MGKLGNRKGCGLGAEGGVGQDGGAGSCSGTGKNWHYDNAALTTDRNHPKGSARAVCTKSAYGLDRKAMNE